MFATRAARLLTRSRIKDALRRDLAKHGFAEVDVPALQVSPGNETHIAAFATEMLGPDGQARRMFLHTSPEFSCKKLLAAGMPRLFAFGPVFRNRERGRLHHPEFTMLEWYRAQASLDAAIADCVRLLTVAAATAGATEFRHRDTIADPFAPPELLTVSDAFRRHAALDLEPLLPGAPDARARFADAVDARGVRVSDDDTWSDLFSKLLTARVEPELGQRRATVLTHYPASEAALARLCPADPRFALRFELYCCGVELANGFAELTDAVEQRCRFGEAERERERIYGERYPLDDDFLAALEGMPDSCGVALGFDRLVMLATGADTIADVLWLPVADPEARPA